VLETRPVPAMVVADIERAFHAFVGSIRQVPPMYSALHHEGRRLYELAREGVEVERRPREVTVHSIALESFTPPDFTIRVRCGKGFYVRTLAADLGAALGPGGALATLVRTRVGPYRLEDAVAWDTVREARAGSTLWSRLLPPDSALGVMPEARLSSVAVRAFVNGQSVTHEGASGPVRVYGPDGAFLGIGARRGDLVKPERLLHADSSRTRVLPA
jgi:tRNA pseudouridine55 synthase